MTLLLALLLACSADLDDGSDTDGGDTDGGETDGGDTDGGSSDGGTSDPVYPTPLLEPSAQVLDPTLDGEPSLLLSIAVPDAASACRVEVEIVGAQGQLRTLAVEEAPGQILWDGADDDGEPFAAGAATAWAWSDCADGSRGSASLPLAVVRLAPAELAFGGPDAQALAFHKRDLLTVQTVPIDTSQYRLLDGVLGDAPVVAPWADPDMPPWDADPDEVPRNLPLGVVMGGSLVVQAFPATHDEAGQALVPDDVTVRLVTPLPVGWSDSMFTFETDPVEDTVGRGSLELQWSWEACVGTGCTPTAVPGHRTTTHGLYRVLGPSQLRDGSADGYADGTPWVGALYDTAEAVQGATDAFGVMDGLRDRIYTDPWLLYDPSDRSYSEYDGAYMYWESITSKLSSWLDRSDGVGLYCHSVSCLLSTLAQGWGVDAEQIVLGVGFDTNLARAAGTETWGRWSFNSHSVATIDGGLHIWDAAIDVDGDEDPYNQPVTAVSPKGMDGEEYLWRLTYDEIGIVNSGKCFVE